MIKTAAYSISILLLLSACRPPYTPKERSLPRIKLPEKHYRSFAEMKPLVFDIPAYAHIVRVKDEPYNSWFNIQYDTVQATLYVSFQTLLSKNNLKREIEVGKRLTMEHAVKATAIKQRNIGFSQRSVFGSFYTLEGNVASPLQFFLTDSTTHYLRGALYFKEATQRDSIQPVVDFLEEDLLKMIESLRWK